MEQIEIKSPEINWAKRTHFGPEQFKWKLSMKREQKVIDLAQKYICEDRDINAISVYDIRSLCNEKKIEIIKVGKDEEKKYCIADSFVTIERPRYFTNAPKYSICVKGNKFSKTLFFNKFKSTEDIVSFIEDCISLKEYWDREDVVIDQILFKKAKADDIQIAAISANLHGFPHEIEDYGGKIRIKAKLKHNNALFFITVNKWQDAIKSLREFIIKINELDDLTDGNIEISSKKSPNYGHWDGTEDWTFAQTLSLYCRTNVPAKFEYYQRSEKNKDYVKAFFRSHNRTVTMHMNSSNGKQLVKLIPTIDEKIDELVKMKIRFVNLLKN